MSNATFYVNVSGVSANAIGLRAQAYGFLYVPEPYWDGSGW